MAEALRGLQGKTAFRWWENERSFTEPISDTKGERNEALCPHASNAGKAADHTSACTPRRFVINH